MQSETLTNFQILETIVKDKLELTPRIEHELDLLSDAPFSIVEGFLQAYKHIIIDGNKPNNYNDCESEIAHKLGITKAKPAMDFHYPIASGALCDIDFDSGFPDDIKDYAREKYGDDKVISIPTYLRYKVKSLLKDLCRVVKNEDGEPLVPFEEINNLNKKLPFRIDSEIAEDMQDVGEDIDAVFSSEAVFSNKEIVEFGQKYPTLLKHFETLYGGLKATGTHAAGIVITPGPARDMIPLKNIKKKIAAEFTEGMGVAELGSLGFIKIDVLGLKTLKMLDTCNRFIMKNYQLQEGQPSPCACYKEGKPCDTNYLLPFITRTGTKETLIDFSRICLNIPTIYKRLAQGETEGVFQFEPEGVTSYMGNYKPTNINDLATITAAYRPSLMDLRLDKTGVPIDSDDINFNNGIPGHIMLLKRRKGEAKVVYPSKKVESILGKTSGMSCFQEQISQMLVSMSNCTFGEAEKVRKFLTKVNPEKLKSDPDTIEKINKFYTKYKEDSLNNNCTLAEIDAVWDMILPFARYGFCKAHAVGYALISYQTAFCRIIFPKEYLTSLMYHNVDNEKLIEYIRTAQKLGFDVKKPDINTSEENFDIDKNNNISAGLITIKGVGEKATQSILANRKEFGSFVSIEDFLSRKIEWRVASIKVLQLLVHSGAFDSISPNRKLTWLKIQVAKGKLKIKDVPVVEIQQDGENRIEIYTEDYNELEKKKHERVSFGFLFEDDMIQNREQIAKYKALISSMSAQKRKDVSIGTINEIKIAQQKNGKDYARISAITTEGEKQQWLIFGHIYPFYKNKITEGEIYCVVGSKDDKVFKIETIDPLGTIIELS